LDNIRNITLSVPELVYFHFKHKCSFYDMSRSDVMVTLIEKFIDGAFDKDFGIEGLVNAGYRDSDTPD